MASTRRKPKRKNPASKISHALPIGRRARHQADTRERIFRAALKLFAERGFFETTVEDITEAADVGKGTFFNYFPSKEHVLDAFGEIQRGKIEAALLEARGGGKPFRILFERMGHALLEEPGRSPAFLRSVMIANLASDSVRKHLCDNLGRGRSRLAEFLRLGQQRGEVRRDVDPAEMARVVQQSFLGSMLFWCMHDGSDLRSWYEPMFRTVWAGIEARRGADALPAKE